MIVTMVHFMMAKALAVAGLRGCRAGGGCGAPGPTAVQVPQPRPSPRSSICTRAGLSNKTSRSRKRV